MKKPHLTQIAKIIYISLFLIMSLVPLVFFNSKQPSVGNESSVKQPEFISGSALNLDFTKEASDYFGRYFGFRNSLVNAGNVFKYSVFKTSGNGNVIVGEEDWLFYGSALKDYIGTELLSDAEIGRIVEIIRQMQEYARDKGSEFVFFVAPDKLSIYGEYMPYYYEAFEGKNNYDRLCDALYAQNQMAAEKGEDRLAFVDLRKLLSIEKLSGVGLYHKLDSHWNNYGAAVSYQAVMEKLEEESSLSHTVFTDLSYNTIANHKGDLYAMLFPKGKQKDEQIYFNYDMGFNYTSRFSSYEDLLITTENDKALNSQKVVLFRDSFGNAFYQFPAQDFKEAVITRDIPYDLFHNIDENTVVMVEIVERNLGNLLKYAPVFEAKDETDRYNCDIASKVIDVSLNGADSPQAFISIKDDLCNIGIYSEGLMETSEAYLVVESSKGDIAFRALPAGNGAAFMLNSSSDILKELSDSQKDIMAENVSIVYEKGGNYYKVNINLTLQD